MTNPTAIEPQEGMRYFDLSKHSPLEAELLYQELSPFVSLPFLMPDGRFLSAATSSHETRRTESR